MRPKILMISTVARTPRVQRIANTYALKYDVMILEWDRESKLPKCELLNSIKVHRFKLKAPFGGRLIFKLPIWTIYLIIFCLRKNYDVIIPQNLDSLMPIWGIAKLKRGKIIYDIADFYSDAYIPVRMPIIKKIVAATERFFIKRVDATIIVNESISEQLGTIEQNNTSIFYNSPYDNYDSLAKKVY
jgi:hypothetical protein